MASIIKKIVARYEADVSGFERGIADAARKHETFTKKVVNDTAKVGKANDDAGKSVTVLGQKFTALGPAANRIDNVVQATGRMKLALAGAAGVVSGILATSFVRLADQSKQVDNQLRGIGAASDAARAKVYALAIETRTPLESTIGLLRSMQKSLSTQSLDQTLRQVGTLNRLLTIGGLDAGQRGSVALQFGQALQSGILQGDELRALRESAPFELMDAIAKRAGGTVEDLKSLGTQGKLTRDVMVGALTDLEQVSKDKFGDFQMTVKDAMVVFNTSLVGAVGEIDNAIGASDALANAVAGMAGFLREHSGALATMAQALSMVAQLALTAAGARGLLALAGPLVSTAAGFRTVALTMGSMTNAAVIAAAAQQALLRGLGGVMALMGGPYGVAIFAAVAAAGLLAKAIDSFDENVREATDAIKGLEETSTTIATLNEEMTRDGERLEEVNKRVADAIASQATEAEATALRDKTAIDGRIAKNQELLNIQREVARQALLQARVDAEAARDQLLGTSRTDAELFAEMGGMMWGTMPPSQPKTLEEERDRLIAKSRKGEAWTAAENEWYKNYERVSALLDDVRRKEQALADSAPEMANAHVLAWNKHRKAIEDTSAAATSGIEELNKKSAERATKLAELEKQHAAAMAQTRALPAGPERAAAARAVQESKRQIDELRDVEGRVAAAKDTVDELNAAMAQTGGMLDRNGVLRDLLNEIERELNGAVLAGNSLDEVTLNQLEDAIAGATVVAERFKIELQNAAGVNFDRITQQMAAGPRPYAQDVANAQDADYQARQYASRREAGTGQNDAELVRQTTRIATEIGISVQDLLSVIMLESGGNPGIRGGAGNRHVGLIQFGPWEQQHYGVSQRSSIEEQMTATGRFLRDRGVREGDPIERIYAAINAGNANLVNRGDTANGGIVGNIRDFTTGAAMSPYRARAAGLLSVYGTEFTDEVARTEESKQASEQQASADEQRAKRQAEYLESLEDENELLELKAKLNGKSSVEQDYQIRLHEKLREAQEAGIDLDAQYLDTQLTMRDALIRRVQDEMQIEAEQAATREGERQRQLDHERQMEIAAQRVAEKKSFQEEIERSIQGIIVGSIMKTGEWDQMVGQLAAKLAEAYLMAGLFNAGPLGSGAGTGILGGIAKGITSWIIPSANGNVMTEFGPLKLARYANGGVARSPQLSLFGEGRQPEAYVPLPDGRSIPVTIKEPNVPSFAGGGAGAGLVRVAIDLNSEMLNSRIVETSAPVAASITNEGIGRYNRNQLPSRIREVQSDPKRIR